MTLGYTASFKACLWGHQVPLLPVGLPRVELGSRPPHGRILPLYYSPFYRTHRSRMEPLSDRHVYRTIHSIQISVGAPRVELGLHAPKASVLPLYYAPTQISNSSQSNCDTVPRMVLRLLVNKVSFRMSFIDTLLPGAHTSPPSGGHRSQP